MKYIQSYKLFEADDEYLKSIFKSKIDWKFYNKIQYVCTEYEDKGLILNIVISLDLHTNGHPFDIYRSDTGFGNVDAVMTNALEINNLTHIPQYKEYKKRREQTYGLIDHNLKSDKNISVYYSLSIDKNENSKTIQEEIVGKLYSTKYGIVTVPINGTLYFYPVYK